MYAPPPKKMLIINILDILKKYTKIKTDHPWSKINEYTKEYENIQVQIKDNNNINFSNENECWIWQAKLEGLKDKKSKLIKYNKNVKDDFLGEEIKKLETKDK